MSITDVPPEYAVLTFGCAECGGKGKHEDSESKGGEQAGPEVLETGLLPVPGRVLERYKKAVGGGDGSMNLEEFYQECWKILRHKNPRLWTMKYDRTTAKAVLAMIAYVDVCMQKVLEKKRLSLSTKAAFDRDSNKKNLVRDVSGNIKLNENGFYFGLATYLQQQASYLCWANANKEKAEKGKGAILKSNLQTAVATAELSISRMTREKDLHGFYDAVHQELRQGVRVFEGYENRAKNDMNPDQDWMGNLTEEEKKNASSLAYDKMNAEIMFSKEDARKITTLIANDYNITPMNMLMRRDLSSEAMLQPKRSLEAGVMLWNVFVFYAEKNAPKPARDWKSWLPSRGKGASGGGTNEGGTNDTTNQETDDTVQGLTTQIRNLEEALKERNERHKADVDSLQTIEREHLEREEKLSEENRELVKAYRDLKKLYDDNGALLKELTKAFRDLKKLYYDNGALLKDQEQLIGDLSEQARKCVEDIAKLRAPRVVQTIPHGHRRSLQNSEGGFFLA